MVSSFLGTDVTPTLKKINEFNPAVKIAEWDGYNSGFKFAKGLVNGMIDVLPDESFLSYCKGNGTKLGDSQKTFRDEWKAKDYDTGLEELQKLLKYSAGLSFNCFYSVRDPTALGSQSYGFGPDIIMWNVLYNLGYMYADAVKIHDLTRPDVTTDSYEEVGERAGDFLMRFFWSRYIPREYR